MKVQSNTPPYCGDPLMTLKSLMVRDPAGGVPALFRGRRVKYSFNTRVAIRKACDLLGLQPGDEVLAPAYNCGSELDPLLDADLTVSLYSVDRQMRINLNDIKCRITSQTRAVYVTHYFGFLQPEMAALRTLCDDHGLYLIEDCALSLLSGAKPADGRTGDISVFCFYKFFPVLAGGALVINDSSISEEVRFDSPPPVGFISKRILREGLRLVLGPERADAALKRLKNTRHNQDIQTAPITPTVAIRPDMPAHYYFDPCLANARISGFTARHLRSFDMADTIARRRENHQTYLDAFCDIPGVTPIFYNQPVGTCPLSFPVLVNNRDVLAAKLVEDGIPASPWWAGYNSNLDFSDHPEACYLKDHVLSLPLHQYLTERHIRHIVFQMRNTLGLSPP